MSQSDPIVHDLEIMRAAKNYGRWIFNQFRSHLGLRIIECGAGIGNFTELLLDRELVVAVDAYAPCLERLRQRFASAPQVVPVLMDIASPEFTALAVHRPDTVVCINVLEHVEDDLRALAQMRTVLPPAGRLALLVPAFPCLYGTIDRKIGHYRRYTKRELVAKLRRAGFRIRALFYMNVVAPLGWWLNNRLLQRQEESPAQVLVFDRWIVPWLQPLEAAVRPPFGLSVIAIAETGMPSSHG